MMAAPKGDKELFNIVLQLKNKTKAKEFLQDFLLQFDLGL